MKFLFLILANFPFSLFSFAQTKNKSIGSSHYKVDSTYNNVMIDKNFFQVQLLQNTDTDAIDKNQMALLIKDRTSKKSVFKKYFTENKYHLFKTTSDHLNTDGKFFFEAISDGGGSGFSGHCYVIANSKNAIQLIPAYTFDELSLLYFIGDTTIIKMEGIWNFKEEEAHFDDHRYVLTKFTFTKGNFIATRLGTTKYKYSSLDDDTSPKKLLQQIKKKEHLLVRSLALE